MVPTFHIYLEIRRHLLHEFNLQIQTFIVSDHRGVSEKRRYANEVERRSRTSCNNGVAH